MEDLTYMVTDPRARLVGRLGYHGNRSDSSGGGFYIYCHRSQSRGGGVTMVTDLIAGGGGLGCNISRLSNCY